MARNRLYQFLYSKVAGLTYVNCAITIGSSGAVTSFSGNLVSSVTLPTNAVGQYQINLNDMYNAVVDYHFALKGPLNATPTAITGLTPGIAYSISTLGSATAAQWTTAGVPTGVTAAVGVVFVAAATSAGTSSAAKSIDSPVASSAIYCGSNSYTSGGLTCTQLLVQCMGPTDSTHPALIPTNPASGSVLSLGFALRSSSITY